MIVEDTFEPLLGGFDPAKMRLPLIKNTFSLWRSLALRRTSSLPFYAQHTQESLHLFSLFVDCRYREQFINKVQPAEDIIEEVSQATDLGLPPNSPLLTSLMP